MKTISNKELRKQAIDGIILVASQVNAKFGKKQALGEIEAYKSFLNPKMRFTKADKEKIRLGVFGSKETLL